MKYARVFLLLTVALALVGCAASPAQFLPALRVFQAAAADGVITPAETSLIISQLPAPGFDWAQAVEIVGSIGGAILGVKLLPDRHLRSPFEQPPQPSQPA